MDLKARIAAEIRASGPMPLNRYMALCLSDPEHGYYMTRAPFGADGDFVTAPEVSQIFGELIGLWALDLWTRMGAPDPFVLCELGPGRGTLMEDALRAAAIRPGFARAARLHLVETSPRLRAVQAQRLAAHRPGHWERFADVPRGPMILIANELFDALPIRQFRRDGEFIRERMIGLGEDGALAMGWSPPCPAGVLPPAIAAAPEGSIFEVCPAGTALAGDIAARLAGDGGAALIIDYGHARTAPGETFQAVRAHRSADPLDAPGEADLTAHVDFEALAEAARKGGAAVHGPVPQGDFLRALGLGPRAARLAEARPDAARDIEAACERLAGGAGMGLVFKVMALRTPFTPPPAGFP